MLLLFSHQVMSNSLKPHGLQPTRLFCSWDFSDKNTGVSGLSFPSSGDLPNPWIRSASPALQEDSLPLNHQGSPSNMFSPAKTETIFTVPQSSEEGDPDITQGAAARVGAGACLPDGLCEGRTGSGD